MIKSDPDYTLDEVRHAAIGLLVFEHISKAVNRNTTEVIHDFPTQHGKSRVGVKRAAFVLQRSLTNMLHFSNACSGCN